MARPSLYDSFLQYLAAHGYAVPAAALHRDVTEPLTRRPELDDVLLAVYADDGGPAQVAERLVDLDEGFQEWRYRHVKMVERTIGDKTRYRRVDGGGLPSQHAVGARVPRSLGDPQSALSTIATRRAQGRFATCHAKCGEAADRHARRRRSSRVVTTPRRGRRGRPPPS